MSTQVIEGKKTEQGAVGQILKDVFGFTSFRNGQRRIVEHLLAGRSALAVFPTGGGKSLCYQLPGVMLQGMTLVVSPLIALMKDQIDFLVSRGVRAARLDSSLSHDELCKVWDDLWNGRLKLLYVAPERFASELFIQRLRRSTISLMAIDEAHCISEWGHNFRPGYLKLAAMARELQVQRVLALTATATNAVAEDIRRNFDISEAAYVNTGFHRPNLVMRTVSCKYAERDAWLLDRLRERPSGAAIVYVTLQKTAEYVSDFLTRQGIVAKAYHAGLESDERHAVQDWFMKETNAVVVATIAFGMGIDKPDIRYVYHYNMPKSLENYMQETGRAGRDGQPSQCDLLLCSEDIATLENFSYGDTPTLEALHGLLDHLVRQPDAFDVSQHELSYEHDIRRIVVATLMTYLELQGVMISTGPCYNEYQFKPHRPSQDMLHGFDQDRTRFLRNMFGRAKKSKTWFTIDIAAAAAAMKEPRERLVAALNYFEQRGDLTLKVAGLRHGYRFVKRPSDVNGLARQLHERFKQAEDRDIARLGQVLNLGAMEQCTVREVLRYFGENLTADCGHCDRCLGEPRKPMPEQPTASLDAAEQRLIKKLIAERHRALKAPRQTARFLCGLPSPAASRAGLNSKDKRFGCLAHLRFSAVLQAAESAMRVSA